MILQFMAMLLEERMADDYDVLSGVPTALFHFDTKEIRKYTWLAKYCPKGIKHGASVFVTHQGIDCIMSGDTTYNVGESFSKSMVENKLYSIYIALAEKIMDVSQE